MNAPTPSWTPPTIRTPRLILRPLTLQDAPAIYSYACKEIVARYTLWQPHQSLADTEAFIRDYVFKHYQDQEYEPLGITLSQQPDTVIGTCGAWWASQKNSTLEIGYALNDAYWGQGITSEAVTALLDYSFENVKVNRIQAHFKKENIASGRVMENAGMTYEGCLRESVFHNNRWWDTVHYAILRSDWEGQP